MSEAVKVSVVILPCRHPQRIKESFSKQTLKEIEILEDCAENGALKARGKYILFADRPCTAEPEALEKIYGFAEENDCEVTVASADYHDICKDRFIPERRFLNLSYFGGKNIILRGEGTRSIMNFTSPAAFNKLFRTDSVKKSGLLKDGLDNAFFVYSMIMSAEKTGGSDEVLFHNLINFEDGEHEELADPADFIRDFERLERSLTEKGVFEDYSFTFLKCFSAEFAYDLRHSCKAGSAVELCRKVTGSLLWEKYQDRLGNDLAGDENAVMLRNAPVIIKTHEMYFVPAAYDDPVLKAGKETDNEALVSVIIPAYNVEDYIEASVRSIMEQSLEDIDIICINDGSSDSTLDILIKLAEEDNRIRVYSQKNSGLSVTRNMGLRHAKGRYIYFFDGDDLLRSEALKELSAQMERDSLDVLFFNVFDCFSDDEGMDTFINDGMAYYRRNGIYPAVCSGSRLMSELLNRNEYFPSIPLQVYRRSYLESINASFVPKIIHEDNLFSFTTLLSCRASGYTEGSYYRRRYRGDSIMTNNVSFRNCYGYFYSYVGCSEFIGGKIPEVTEEMNEVVFRIFNNAVMNQMRLPVQEKYFFYGLDRHLFVTYSDMVFRQAELRKKEIELKERNEEKRKLTEELGKETSAKAALDKKLSACEDTIRNLNSDLEELRKGLGVMTSERNALQNRLTATADEKVRLENRLKDMNLKREELDKRLNESNRKNAELNDRVKKIYAEKNEIYDKLQITYKEKSEINRKLQDTYEEKSEINRKLQDTYEEKSEINRKLQTAYEEKSEINRKLQTAYEEKSELNRKLKLTYEEKSERGRIIKDQKAQIRELRKQNNELQSTVRTQKAEIKNLSEKLSNKIIRKVKKLFKRR